MCIDFDGHHFGGSSFDSVIRCGPYPQVSIGFKKKKNQVKSPNIWSRVPETGSDPPIGSDRESGRDTKGNTNLSYPSFNLCTLSLMRDHGHVSLGVNSIHAGNCWISIRF